MLYLKNMNAKNKLPTVKEILEQLVVGNPRRAYCTVTSRYIRQFGYPAARDLHREVVAAWQMIIAAANGSPSPQDVATFIDTVY